MTEEEGEVGKKLAFPFKFMVTYRFSTVVGREESQGKNMR